MSWFIHLSSTTPSLACLYLRHAHHHGPSFIPPRQTVHAYPAPHDLSYYLFFKNKRIGITPEQHKRRLYSSHKGHRITLLLPPNGTQWMVVSPTLRSRSAASTTAPCSTQGFIYYTRTLRTCSRAHSCHSCCRDGEQCKKTLHNSHS